MAETTVGLDVDGQRVTVVECVGDTAVSVRSVMLDDLKDTVDLVLAGYKQHRNDPPLRAVLSCDQIVTRAIDVTPAMKNRQVFEDVVYTALPLDRASTMSAGLFFDPTALTAASNTLTAGVAAVAPSKSITDTYRAFVGRKVEVVPPSFALAGMDGLWLGLRYAVADLTLVVNGRPVQYRQLRAGGLDTVAGILGDGYSGIERLDTALHRSGPSDPVAEAELDRWLRIVAMETRQTMDFWSRSGDPVPGTVIAYGAAAAAVGLEGALSSANITNSFPDDLSKAMSFIPPADRPAAVLAFAAARTVGIGSPQAVFVNPVVMETSAENRRRTRQLLRIGAGVAVATVMLGSTIVPLVSAWTDRQAAAAELLEAQQRFTPLAEVYDQLAETYLREDAIFAVNASDLAWSEVIELALGTAPQVNISQFSASQSKNDAGTDVVVVSITADKIKGGYNDLTEWLDRLRQTEGVTRAWSSSYTNRDGKASFQLSFELEPGVLGTPRTATSIVTPVTLAPVVTTDQPAALPADQPSESEATPTAKATTDAEVTR